MDVMDVSEVFLENAKKPQRSDVWRALRTLAIKIAAILLGALIFFTFLYGAIRYTEAAMNPALKDGDMVVYYRFFKDAYLPQDVIVFNKSGYKQVRRVVALAGDVVDITPEGLVINGAVQQESGIYQRTERFQTGVDFPLTVPDGHVFVLADSRAEAEDSRVYGCVKIEDTLGKVMTIVRRRLI